MEIYKYYYTLKFIWFKYIRGININLVSKLKRIDTNYI